MENINVILQKENICLEDLSIGICRRIQKLNLEYSEDFKIPEVEWNDLKEKLPFENINNVTLKKFIENIVVSKHLKHKSTDFSLFELIYNNQSYRFYPKSFYYSKE